VARAHPELLGTGADLQIIWVDDGLDNLTRIDLDLMNRCHAVEEGSVRSDYGLEGRLA
jgi:hypothetical protein